jgi:hypothetical protein
MPNTVWLTIWNRIFDGKAAAWTAFFTLVLTVTTVQLMCLNQKANETSIATQRAFVNFDGSITGFKILNPATKQVAGIEFLIGWQNSGTTPTKRALGRANRQLWPSEMPKSFDFKDMAGGNTIPTVIGPKASVRHSLIVPIGDLLDIQRRNHHLYFWGWMVYQDIFPGSPIRLTEFCGEITNFRADKQDLADPSIAFAWDVVPCPVPHNCYDEDCADYRDRIKAGSL